MITFEGELSSLCRYFIIKQAKKRTLVTLLSICCLLIILFIFLALFVSSGYWFSIVGVAIIPLYCIFPLPKEKIDSLMPIKILIDENKIVCKYKDFTEEKLVSNVKKVIDYGDFYHIIFGINFNSKFICQKDLIKEGTLEKFENLFEGKIIRKHKG